MSCQARGRHKPIHQSTHPAIVRTWTSVVTASWPGANVSACFCSSPVRGVPYMLGGIVWGVERGRRCLGMLCLRLIGNIPDADGCQLLIGRSCGSRPGQLPGPTPSNLEDRRSSIHPIDRFDRLDRSKPNGIKVPSIKEKHKGSTIPLSLDTCRAHDMRATFLTMDRIELDSLIRSRWTG